MDRRKVLDMPSLIEIEGVGPSLAAACVKKDYRSIAKIAAATPKELASVSGITEKSALRIIASAKSLLLKPSMQKATTVKTKTKAKTMDNAKGKPDRKISKKPSTKSAVKEEKMSTSDSKDKIKKLKKKIKKLKKKKKKIVKKESKRLNKIKATKSSKKK